MAMLNAWATGAKPWTHKDVTGPVRDVINLRMRLLPYMYTAFADYHHKGIPPFRAMILEKGFGEGKSKVIAGKLDSEKNPYAMGQIIEKNDQYMFGPSIMVAPFIKNSTRFVAYDFLLAIGTVSTQENLWVITRRLK